VGTLRNLITGVDVVLRTRTLVGRSSRAEVRLIHDGGSSEHASIFWAGAEWVLRDLTSRNGTKINEQVLAGREARLNSGDLIVFGDPRERWSWVDNAAPQALAVREDAIVVAALDGLLSLPDADEPHASVYAGEDGWELEVGGVTRKVRDGESVDVGVHRFRLDLPSVHPTANRTRTFREDRSLSAARMVFTVSQDQEFVALTLEVGRYSKDLSARSFHYMLLELARVRQAEERSGVIPDEAGWLYADDLATRLGTSVEKLNVDIHRARQLIAQTKLVEEPETIVQRRRITGQVRFGVSRVQINEPALQRRDG
jgi:hypothetical protein